MNVRNHALWRTRGGIIALATVVLIIGTSAVFALNSTPGSIPIIAGKMITKISGAT